jgi:Tol biopolymer transport system component
MIRRRLSCLSLLLILALANALAAQTARHPLRIDDLSRFRNVSDPQISPDGQRVAYVVSSVDAKEDKTNSHIWIVNIDGTNDRQITFSASSENSPRWSPDGKYLSFSSSRPGKIRGNQVWILDLGGGEATQLTELKGRLQGHEWSPDSKRLALVIGDPDPEADPGPSPQPGATPRVPKPIVIDRYKFKQDGQGYLRSGRHSYIYLYEIETKKLERLTKSKWDESSPAWSPDGNHIAFMSNHADDPDRDPAAQLYVADAKPGSTEKQLTPAGTRVGRSRPEWSPDSKWIAFLEGDERKFGAYNMDHLALVSADGSSAPKRLKATEDLDRGVSSPRFSPDGKSIRFLVTDDRSVYPMRANLSGGAAERLLSPPVVVSNWNFNGGKAVVMSGGSASANEVHVWE